MNKHRSNQRLRRRLDLDKGLLNRGWHSRAYHRHFEGYVEREEVNAAGKTVIRRVYTGEFRRLELPKRKRVGLRLTYFILWALMAAAFGFSASRPIGANHSWYLAISQMLGVCSLGYVFIKLLTHSTAPRNLTVGDWKASSLGLIKGSLVNFWLMELTAVLTLLYLFLESGQYLTHLLCVGLYALSGLLSMFINRLEANAPYTVFPSSEEAPDEGSYIDV